MPRAELVEAKGWRWVKGASRRWTVRDDGIHVAGRDGPLRRARGQGAELARVIYEEFGDEITAAADTFGTDPRIIIATVCIESAGNPTASRFEKHLNDWSFGLTQTLTNTALALGRMYGFPRGDGEWEMPMKSVRGGGDAEAWRKFLYKPLMSLSLCAGYHARNDRHFKCDGDPIVIYSAYNAGSPRFTTKNPWGLVNYSSALDAFAGFYGHSCELEISR